MHRNNKSLFPLLYHGRWLLQSAFVLLKAVTTCNGSLFMAVHSAWQWLAHSHIPWFIWKMPLSTQLGFVVSCDWHATDGISSRMIVRESHTGTLKNKQRLFERQTGCKHWRFYGKITWEQRGKEGEKKRIEVKYMHKERRKKEVRQLYVCTLRQSLGTKFKMF